MSTGHVWIYFDTQRLETVRWCRRCGAIGLGITAIVYPEVRRCFKARAYTKGPGARKRKKS